VIYADGKIVNRFAQTSELNELMMIYSAGFIIIYSLFLLMHRHALKKRDELMLNDLEVYNTHSAMWGNMSMIGVGIFSFVLALTGYLFYPELSMVSGIFYALIGPVLGFVYKYRIKKMKQLFSQKEIDQVMTEEVVMEVKKRV
jgi:hypothetical protein